MCTACFLDRTGLISGKFPHDYGKNCNKRINLKNATTKKKPRAKTVVKSV